jgi:nucleoside-diphosphate-sugar epimerase
MESDLQPDIRSSAANEIVNQYLSASKARRTLAWQPAYSLDTALAETVEWYRDFFASSGQAMVVQHAQAKAAA